MTAPRYCSEYVILHDVRGFSRTVIPIRPVTFLVGENSSGKSTILSIRHLIRSFPFWNEFDFDTTDQHLGGFADLHSQNADSDYFTVGLATNKIPTEDASGGMLILASFSNNEGLPKLIRFTSIAGDLIVTVAISGEKIAYTTTSRQLAHGVPVTPEEIDSILNLHLEFEEKKHKFLPISVPTHFQSGFLPQAVGEVHRIAKAPAIKSNFRRHMIPYSIIEQESIWIAPIRSKPQRVYEGAKKAYSAEGDHTPYMIRKQCPSKKAQGKFGIALRKYGKESHLFEDVGVKRFGVAPGSPFEVQAAHGGKRYNISNLGYGVSQVLPILVEVITRPKTSSFSIQQPEVHLHPRAQAAIGELLYHAAESEGKRFVVETHSDFIIDRLRLEMNRGGKKKGSKLDVSVLFCEQVDGYNNVTELRLSPDGHYPEDQPEKFREFFINEQINLLGI